MVFSINCWGCRRRKGGPLLLWWTIQGVNMYRVWIRAGGNGGGAVAVQRKWTKKACCVLAGGRSRGAAGPLFFGRDCACTPSPGVQAARAESGCNRARYGWRPSRRAGAVLTPDSSSPSAPTCAQRHGGGIAHTCRGARGESGEGRGGRPAQWGDGLGRGRGVGGRGRRLQWRDGTAARHQWTGRTHSMHRGDRGVSECSGSDTARLLCHSNAVRE